MRAADAPARTWLLGAAAAWAVAVWALALAGMGARAPVLPDDPALLQRLPQARPAAPAALGPPGEYAAISARPLFSENRQPRVFLIQGEGEAAPTQAFDYVLTSVLIAGNTRLAILQSPDGSKSLRVKLGEAHESQPSWRLASLSPRSATFDGPEGQRTLELRVFDGQGGVAPTVATQPAMPDPAGTNPTPPSPPPPPPSGGAPVQITPTPVQAPPAATGATEAPMTEAAQMEAIRQRIEARRAQLRKQAQPPSAPTVPQP